MTENAINYLTPANRKPCRVRNWLVAAALLALPVTLCAKSTQIADSVFISGRIYRVDAGRNWAQAVAIRDGRFIAVGSDAEIEAYIGPETTVTNLAGRMVMPGINDLHIHSLEGAFIKLFSCNFPPSATLTEIASRIKACAANRSPGSWIQGGVFAAQLLDSDKLLRRSILDIAAPANPVVLRSSGGHSAWVNSAALRLAGIGKGTPDPGNNIVRDRSTGEPTGVLKESAAGLVLALIPDYSPEQYAAAIKYITADLSRQGITAIKNAQTSMAGLAAYAQADKAGGLTLRVATSLAWPAGTDSQRLQTELLRNRSRFQTAHVNPNFVKIFVDGSAGGRKAAYLEPYQPGPQIGANYFGELLVKSNKLNEYLTLLDKKGISVKMHCGGDAAVRAALDAIAAARHANGNSGIPHEISHPNLVSDDDMPRFKALNAIADLTPVAWYPNPILRLLTRTLGEARVQRMWKIRSFVESGATAVYGSDWPAITPNTNPWRAMEAMITRRDPDDDDAREQFVPEQAIDLATAIEIFTQNGAYAMREASLAGSIEVGKYADMIVLKKNLFKIPPDQIGDTQVILTLLSGQTVYRRQQ